ncbi:MAG: adenylyltransferase/cytidyltransferase family protein [Pseudomonas sp.]|uniref:adenylyltransferase/cytidyltransferase family protein n=1 Tax=Pseudomonas abieticivorans TaxID=2931382 RepID=UPI0020BFCBF6|nr:adenylyltransferase/cytidyltransferase family protein [Pseudomonas sp. PIA16]MDE1168423.1 adenylyltransferase/cytidyltransferase family protein [Pseudomonas sp.]
MKKVILTYGTFDLFHIGHLNLLRNLKSLGDYLIVGVSTDAFNAQKGKRTVISFEERIDIVQSLKCVDLTLPEHCWEQKARDITEHGVSVFGMGDDWQGHFDGLKALCEVVYLPRTAGISSSALKHCLREIALAG